MLNMFGLFGKKAKSKSPNKPKSKSPNKPKSKSPNKPKTAISTIVNVTNSVKAYGKRAAQVGSAALVTYFNSGNAQILAVAAMALALCLVAAALLGRRNTPEVALLKRQIKNASKNSAVRNKRNMVMYHAAVKKGNFDAAERIAAAMNAKKTAERASITGLQNELRQILADIRRNSPGVGARLVQIANGLEPFLEKALRYFKVYSDTRVDIIKASTAHNIALIEAKARHSMAMAEALLLQSQARAQIQVAPVRGALATVEKVAEITGEVADVYGRLPQGVRNTAASVAVTTASGMGRFWHRRRGQAHL